MTAAKGHGQQMPVARLCEPSRSLEPRDLVVQPICKREVRLGDTFEQVSALAQGIVEPLRIRGSRPRAHALQRTGPWRNTPSGIRTRATGVKGRRPRPLDDGGLGAA